MEIVRRLKYVRSSRIFIFQKNDMMPRVIPITS